MPPHLGGLETAAESLFQNYRKAGYEARWVASRVPTTAASRNDGRVRVRCWNGLEQWLGVPWPVWGPEGIRELVRLVRWADVLHVHDCLYLSSVLAVLLARRRHKPILLSQQIGFVWYRSAFLRALEHVAYHTLGCFVLRRASQIVCCSPATEQYVRKLLRDMGAGSTTILNGVDANRFRVPTADERAEARHCLGLPSCGRIMLFTGRLVEKKGVPLFLEVCRQRPAELFLLVGDGPCKPPHIPNLRWMGALPWDQMPTVYQAADVLLLPSHSEGLPLSILEAMASGLPVVTSAKQACADFAGAEERCLVVEQSVPAFMAALDRLWAVPEGARSLGMRGRELIEERCSLTIMAGRYLSLLGQLSQAC